MNISTNLNFCSKAIGKSLKLTKVGAIFLLLVLAPLRVCADVLIDVHSSKNIAIKVDSISLNELINELATRLDLRLRVNGQLNGRIESLQYDNIEVAKLLETLLKDYSVVMQYSAANHVVGVWVSGNEMPSGSVSIVANEQSPRAAIKIEEDSSILNEDEILRVSGFADDDVINTLAKTLHKNPDIHIKLSAVQALGDSGNIAAVPVLESQLSHPAALLRQSIAKAFAHIESPQSMLLLGQLLLGDKDEDVRISALESLSNSQEIAAEAFIKAVINDPSARVSHAARQYLGLNRSS